MPKIAAEVSGPISQTNKITMVSNGDGPVGASRITQEVRIRNEVERYEVLIVHKQKLKLKNYFLLFFKKQENLQKIRI